MPHPALIEPVADGALRAIVAKTLGPSADLQESRLLKGGQFNTAYYLETRRPDRRLVLRVAPPDDRHLFRYERGMMAAEPWIYARLAEAGVPVPDVVALDTSRSIVGRVYIVHEFVDALPSNDARVPAGARPGLMREAGALTARIHSITGEVFGWPARNGDMVSGSWGDVFGDLLAETCGEACAAGVLDESDAGAAMARFREVRALFDACREPVLVHNDIWAPNILVAEDAGDWSVRAIIDADRAVFADREFEYILWDKDAHYEDFMAGYGTPLDPSPEAALRRAFYRFYWYLFAAWCYRCQIVRPEAQAANREVALSALADILGGGCSGGGPSA